MRRIRPAVRRTMRSLAYEGNGTMTLRSHARGIVACVHLYGIGGAEQIMGMPDLAQRWTASEVRGLTAEQQCWWPRYELVDGELLVTPSPRPAHARVISRLQYALAEYLQRERVGLVLASPSDIALEPESIVQPDLFVTTLAEGAHAEHWSEITRLLLAVEVLSPSTARIDRGVKREYYQRTAVEEYWIVDIESRLIERWTPADERPEILREELTWQPGGSTTSFTLDLAELFPAA